MIARVRATEGNGLRTFRTGHPRVWSRTSGATVWDADGVRYIDLDSGSAVATVGYCHPRVTAAIREQAGVMTHCPSGVPSEPRAAFYERLLGIAPPGLTRVLPAVNGALANETAIQLARASTGRNAVVSFAGTYLGRSLGAVGKAGKRAYRAQLRAHSDAQFLPYPDPYRSPWARGADPSAVVLSLLEQMLLDPGSGLDMPACVVLEPMQGNGGAVMPPEGFLTGLRSLCDRTETVLIFDEIQAGFGRSGTMWASEHEGVRPDLMTVGKGIGGGLGIAAILGGETIMSTWEPDAVTATFLVNALNCVAATAAIDVLVEERLVERSKRLGLGALQRLREELADNPRIGDVRGRGLLIGLEVVADRDSARPDAELAARFAGTIGERGVLVGRSGRFANVVKVCPPLVIDEGDLDDALTVVIDTLNGRS